MNVDFFWFFWPPLRPNFSFILRNFPKKSQKQISLDVSPCFTFSLLLVIIFSIFHLDIMNYKRKTTLKVSKSSTKQQKTFCNSFASELSCPWHLFSNVRSTKMFHKTMFLSRQNFHCETDPKKRKILSNVEVYKLVGLFQNVRHLLFRLLNQFNHEIFCFRHHLCCCFSSSNCQRCQHWLLRCFPFWWRKFVSLFLFWQI